MSLQSYDEYQAELEAEEAFREQVTQKLNSIGLPPIPDIRETTGAPGPGMANDGGSGLIDIRAIAASAATNGGPAASPRSEESLPPMAGFGGPIAAAPVLMPISGGDRPDWLLPVTVGGIVVLALVLVAVIFSVTYAALCVAAVLGLGLVGGGVLLLRSVLRRTVPEESVVPAPGGGLFHGALEEAEQDVEEIWLTDDLWLGEPPPLSDPATGTEEGSVATSGRILAHRLDISFVDRLEILSRFEGVLSEGDDHVALLGNHCWEVEFALRELLFMPALPLADCVLSHLDKRRAEILSTALARSPARPTLGLIEIWLQGFRHLAKTESFELQDWLGSRFGAPTSLELFDIRSILTSKEFVAFVGALREELRNPIMHGRLPPARGPQYGFWCAETYGRLSLATWLDEGLVLGATDGPGWIGRLLGAQASTVTQR